MRYKMTFMSLTFPTVNILPVIIIIAGPDIIIIFESMTHNNLHIG